MNGKLAAQSSNYLCYDNCPTDCEECEISEIS